MAKKKEEEEKSMAIEQNESHNLLGDPSFEQLENGRFKCIETGHELIARDKDTYALSKHCRIGLIDFSLARDKPPLNMFRQDPLSRSKLICKLTGVTINKSEEHIWKHMNGKRFLNILEKKEKEMPRGTIGKRYQKNEENGDKGLKMKEKIKDIKNMDEILSEVRDSAGKSSDSEDEAFWMPPVGECRDNDRDDQWGGGSESEPENDDVGEEDDGAEEAKHEAGKLCIQTKRMSLEIGPSSFASRKKKKKITS